MQVLRPTARPKIVTLCGSARFREEFAKAYFEETIKGKIVLSIAPRQGRDLTEDEKSLVDSVYMTKIEMSDEIFCVNVGGYVGESTRRELWYAAWLGKLIRYLEPEKATDVSKFFASWTEWEEAALKAASGGHKHHG